ncbi:MAG: hypothetical protein AB8B91_00315 [Rubripirellula sp.]
MARKNETDCSKLWIGLSFLLSACILAWTFTLPFRTEGGLVSSVTKTDFQPEPLELIDQVRQKRTEAEDYRQAALELDEKLMRAVAEKNTKPENLPGIEQSRDRYERRKQSVRKQLLLLGVPEEGTPEWNYAKKLLESLQDAPAGQ